MFYYIFENRRRDKKYGVSIQQSETEDESVEDKLNLSDRQMKNFRYLR